MADIITIDGWPSLQGDDEEIVRLTGEPDSPEPPPSERESLVKPEDVDWSEWRRRGDAIRTVAREMDTYDHGDIREFLEGRTSRELNDDEIGQFRQDVISWRVADLTDILDEQLRSGSDRLKRARRTVRVQAPRGWLKRAFNSLDERAVGQVAARLLQRGHDTDSITEKVINRVKDEEIRQRLTDNLAAQQLAVEFSGEAIVENMDLLSTRWDTADPGQLFDDLITLLQIYRDRYSQKE